MSRLPNLILSALVALVVASVTAPAASLPRETHASSTRIAALAKRVDALQVRLADTRQIAQQAQTEADDATQITACINGALYMATDQDGGWENGDPATDSTTDLIPTLDPGCAS